MQIPANQIPLDFVSILFIYIVIWLILIWRHIMKALQVLLKKLNKENAFSLVCIQRIYKFLKKKSILSDVVPKIKLFGIQSIHIKLSIHIKHKVHFT